MIGIDVQADTQFEEERITTYLCDSTAATDVARLTTQLKGLRPDIIVDDASHAQDDQLATLRNFYPLLRTEGLYFIEDIDPASLLNTSPEVVTHVCGDAPFFFAGLQNDLCIICKASDESHGTSMR